MVSWRHLAQVACVQRHVTSATYPWIWTLIKHALLEGFLGAGAVLGAADATANRVKISPLMRTPGDDAEPAMSTLNSYAIWLTIREVRGAPVGPRGGTSEQGWGWSNKRDLPRNCPSVYCWWEFTVMQLLWKTVWHFLKKLNRNYQRVQWFHFLVHMPKNWKQGLWQTFVSLWSEQSYSQQTKEYKQPKVQRQMNG